MRRLKLVQKCISFLLVSLLTCIYALNLSAKMMGDDIDFDGEGWKEGLRSIITVIPVTASINGTLLTIECTTGRSDITVHITGADGFSYEKMYPASEAYLITIDLSSIPKGACTLDLTNQWGDLLTGNFEIK
ncbi:DUF3244 domain-containing protein [uncultured Parabacteroides sp.]|uniref:DUF3244 domain-containing protein n=1 Tax=uncultured Parabacteroides sp. TaxID=512312 RepID=UPI002634EB72|nr:DUF3244 domain-containing protein [uncultured Parabacteroides sp.]